MSELDPSWFPLPVVEGDDTIDLGLIERALHGPRIAGATKPSELLYLDCGVWAGDGKTMAAQRPFGVVCGRTAVLCSFSGTRPLEPLTEGPVEEIEPINRVLLALAGPMRFDVTVHRALVCPSKELDLGGERTARLLLPEMHLPLVPRLPNVDPSLIPDPNKATCPCHGPVVTRMLYGTPNVPSRYRAVGAPLSRNPNDWFYWMAESYRAIADDLLKWLDRLAKISSRAPVEVVQLGGACEVWTGYRCVVQSMGRMALVRPTIDASLGLAELLAEWSDKALPTKIRDVMARLVGLRRVELLHSASRPLFEVEGEIRAEARAPDALDETPIGYLALREQKIRLVGAQPAQDPGFRLPALERAVQMANEKNFGVYATAGSSSPCLMRVRYLPRPASQTRYATVA